jgi:general stress protein 26
MSKYDDAIKLVEECCGNGKEVIIALATISLSANAAGNPRPAVRMVCAYYEDGAFYVSTDARKTKTLQIEKNNEVSVCGMDGYTFQGMADNLGWIKDEKNAKIRAKFIKIFDWFNDEGGENDPNSIVLRITLTEGTIFDNEKKYGEHKYEIDFINKVVK